MAVYTVSEISAILSAKVRLEPKFRGIAVRGEITDLARDRSGHMYFRLRDSEAGIKCVMFAQYAKALKFIPADGMGIIAFGALDYYSRDGSCEIKATQLLPDGAGAGYTALLRLKEKLSALGIFTAPKKPIPRYPKKIAVVTSSDGAAISDVKKVISLRYPIVKIEHFPTLVQGIDAPSSIVKALSLADKSGADTIILTRGGGSSEDLSAFNTEEVVMAVASCETPIISAVGHEIDWSLSDLAADLRAATPSAAAELATPDISAMKSELKLLESVLKSAAAEKLTRRRERLEALSIALSAYSPKSRIKSRETELNALDEKLSSLVSSKLRLEALSLGSIKTVLDSLDPENVLSRGYAMVKRGESVISDPGSLSVGDGIEIVMRGGTVGAEVKYVGEKNEL